MQGGRPGPIPAAGAGIQTDAADAALAHLQEVADQCEDGARRGALLGHLRCIRELLAPQPVLPHTQQNSRQYKFSALLEALLLARLVCNAGELAEIMRRSVNFLFGIDIAKFIWKQIQDKQIRIPSPATMSRTRLKLDSCQQGGQWAVCVCVCVSAVDLV